MRPERWAQIEDLFHRAVECGPDERIRLLQEAGGTDPELRREVELLLESCEGAGAHLRAVVGGNAQSVQESRDALADTRTMNAAAASGNLIGPYHLLQTIGEGGMGEVWLAEQREPVRRRVALKLLKAGMNTREVIARFESERQALALMDHPAIAKVFDAGFTPQGVPYFVMEYVAGVPITVHCDSRRLTTRQRLELFIHVCHGVQHAHQKAIIHRDLKPSNILVTEVDGQAAPKIIDFGVAKALGQKLTADTLFTRVGALVGTPEYMSPEQALSSGEDIDTRTDVYSLGIVLYELLTGMPPMDLHKLTLDEFLRRLREDEPPKPSTKIRAQDLAKSAEVARTRQTEPVALAKQVCGDLDSIVLKALEKDRSRRYGSPADLAADIGRYLKSEAVAAVPPSLAYRARKFGRRHRAAVVTAAAFAMVLIAAAGISIRQSIRANREAAMAQAINDFLQNDLLAQASAARQSGSSAKPDPDLKVRIVLDRAAARVAGRFDRQPQVEAAIRDTIGETYMDLGIYPEAQQQLQRALDLRRQDHGIKDPKTLETMSRLGTAAYLEGKYPEAEAQLTQSLDIQRRVLGAGHADTLYTMNNLAMTYKSQGKYAQAETLLTQTMEISRRVLGPEHPDTLASMRDLAQDYDDEGKYAQAEALLSQILEISRRALGPEHLDTLACMHILALVYDDEGKYAQAEMLDRQIADIRRRALGAEHPDTLRSMNNLALEYESEGRYAQAEALFNQTLEVQRRVLGPEHRDTLTSMDNLANVYADEGKYGQAEALLSETLEITRRVFPSTYPLSISILSDFAPIYQRERKYALAETYASQGLMGRRQVLGSQHPDTMASAADLALAYVSQGKFLEAEPLAREALEFNRKKQPDDWQRFRAETLLGAVLAGQKKYAEAEPLLLEGYRGMLARKDRIAVPDRYHLDRAREWIVQLYQAWGNPKEAAEWRKR